MPRLLVPTPAGEPLTQRRAAGWAAEPWLVIACGRYEGIDARVLTDAARRMPVEEVSLGDYVLAGGEVAALVVVEAVSRLVPGVLGNPASAELDSFSDGLAASSRPPPTPAPRAGATCRSRRCCAAATTAPWPGGVATARSSARRRRDPICSTRCWPATGPPRSTRGTARS